MADQTEIQLSIVIPVYGSARILPALIAGLERELTGDYNPESFEVVLVHDDGPDESWPVIRNLAASRPWLRGIDLSRNAGQHNAIMAGLRYARGSILVTMDDDLQHDPKDIPRLVESLQSGADVCYMQFVSRRHAAWKRLGSWFNDLVARWLLRKPPGLYLSPFRAFRSHVKEEMLRYEGPFVYLDGLILQSTTRISTISGEHHARQDGRSGYSLRKSISLWLQMATSFSVAPLRLASMAGIAFSLLGFFFAVVLVAQRIMNPTIAVGWTSLIVAILIMGGIQLIALGVIGEYVGRVLLNVGNRPQFVAREYLNIDPSVRYHADPKSVP
ncbi:glycosyltransferase family 2 protein [Luteimonas salinilitoris]|uniref:Glycosyltransferase family 2 protein n=1 Tax=Luteimonas salinilitoris TaxID=3237697 RepID=A0ABV4HVL9_9GAMM